ncbi:MAG: NAD(P)/FAD-dependent oxidoreductase [Oscillospiraceae bacterium]|nr:NAD(P)/FAD-dependent oxidoreductase [Oscillospiraceae bacterium]
MKTKIAVVGGGAAGMMFAAHASAGGADVTVFERNPQLGRKLAITGKGRCNLTNLCPTDELMASVVTNPRFMHSAFAAFTPADLMEYIESLGVPLKVERGNRVFPVSDKAYDIIDALRSEMRRHGCRIVHQRVEDVVVADGEVVGVVCDGNKHSFDKVVLATGGLSYPRTGSDGDGLRIAARLGVAVTPPSPALVPLEIKENSPALLQGLSLRNVSLKMIDEGEKTVFSDFGELIFAHYGVSGPLVLSASSHMKGDAKYTISIDLKPALDRDTLDRRILSDFEKYRNRDFANALSDLLPQKLAAIFPQICGIPATAKVNSVTAAQRGAMVDALKDFRLTVTAKRPIDEAIITSGGVSVKEVNPKTMECKSISGLYFIGEILDVDALTGGFNLQIAFSTAVAAARSILE